MSGRRPSGWASLVGLLVAVPALAQTPFTYRPPGELVSGSGRGRADTTVYAPGMRYPIEKAPSFPNSQVWGHGGGSGPAGGQCHTNNYSYPWRDNYCESRSWDMPLCPSGQGHQGQDIRPSTCVNNVHWAVATEDGTITNIGSYSVYLKTPAGVGHRYLHMDPDSVTVKVGDKVTKGQRIGRVSNAFGGTPTTIHLHYDLEMNVSGMGVLFVPPYMSLVRSYEALLNPTAAGGLDAGTPEDELKPSNGGGAGSGPVIPVAGGTPEPVTGTTEPPAPSSGGEVAAGGNSLMADGRGGCAATEGVPGGAMGLLALLALACRRARSG